MLGEPILTDGVVLLRPLVSEDAPDHLAGEDEATAKWLSGGRSTLASVRKFIEDCQEHWRTGGPRRAFGVFDCVEADLALFPNPGEVNISFGVFQPWRGRGIALRAIDLMAEYLRAATDCREMILRIAPANLASLGVATKAGFRFHGMLDESNGPMAHFSRSLDR